MATLTSYDFNAPPLPWGHAFKATAKRIIGRWRNWVHEHREFARVTRELHAYSDRDLADLGVRLYDIPAIARGTFRRS